MRLMMLRLLSVEFLKIRRKLLWLLILLGPLGVVGLQAVNFGLRYDYLVRHLYRDNLWGGLTDGIVQLMLPSLFIGVSLVASMAAGIEHQTNAWKMTLALPLRKPDVFAAKFLLTALLLLVSSTLIVPFTALLGWTLGAGPAPYGTLFADAYAPYLAILPFIALHTWLSVTMANQAVPLTIGIVGTVLSLFAMYFSDWMPLKWPMLAALSHNRLFPAGAGLGLALVLLTAGLMLFERREVR